MNSGGLIEAWFGKEVSRDYSLFPPMNSGGLIEAVQKNDPPDSLITPRFRR